MAAANRFDQAAEMPILNTYVPIDFGNLYRIGATQKAAVDQAIADVGAAVQHFGEFRSPSRIDTENYYNMTIGQMSDLISSAAADPDRIKDPGFRVQLYSRLNGLNYAGLSQLRESADNLRAGLEMRAKMEAAGKYNENWDDADIANYDTLKTGKVFEDITPVEYMNANQLSNAYFDNLKAGTIGSTWRDGVKYTVTGNTVEDLRAVADAHMNDLIATPQGRMYMRDFLRKNNGDETKSIEDFRDMIVASQMDRTLRPTLTVDPAWLASLKASRSGGGSDNLSFTPTRLHFIREGDLRVANANLTRNVTESEYKDYKQEQDRLYRDFINARNAYNTDPSDENYIRAIQAENRMNYNQGKLILQNNRREMDKKFIETTRYEKVSGTGYSMYDELPENMSHKDYVSAVGKALSSVENSIGLSKEDKIITGLGALPINITEANGTTKPAFQFNTSEGFLLPEIVMKLIADTDTQKVPIRDIRRGTWWAGSESLGFDQALSGGAFGTTQFIPENKIIQVAPDVHAIKGKVRISRDEIENVLGTGSWFSRSGNQGDRSLIGSQRTDDILENAYNMKKVKQKVGEDDVTFYEFDTYRLLPSETLNPEWWQAVNTSWANTPTQGGIGSASMAAEAFNSAARTNLGY